MKMILQLFFYSLITAIMIGCGEKKNETAKDQAEIAGKIVKAIHISEVETENIITAYGEIVLPDDYNLSFQKSGIISQFFTKKGQRIVKGQKIAILEDKFSSDKLDKIELNKNQIQKSIEELKSQESRLTKQLNDNRELLRDSLLSQESIDNTAQALLSVKTNINRLKDQLEISQRDTEITLNEKELNELLAPVSGVVLDIYAKVGETVAPGQVILAMKSSESDKVFEIKVSDTDILKLSKGDMANVTLDALPDQPISAFVSYLPYSKEEGVYKVELALDKVPEEILAGLFGKAKITSSEKLSGIKLPHSAVVWANERNAKIYIHNEGKASLREVVIKKLSNDHLLVEGDLSDGDQVLINVNGTVSDGDDIIISDL